MYPPKFPILSASLPLNILLAQWAQALELLERFSTHFDRPGIRSWTTTSFLSLYTVALSQTGKTEQARATAMRLLALTKPGGYLRLYLDVGEPMKQVLQSVLDVPQDGEEDGVFAARSYVVTLLEAFEREASQRTRQAEKRDAETVPSCSPLLHNASPAASVLIEPLSRQEQRVLRLLAAGRSNQEIASDLIVSINTVKAHVKKIYSKLRVSNRISACEVARTLHLL